MGRTLEFLVGNGVSPFGAAWTGQLIAHTTANPTVDVHGSQRCASERNGPRVRNGPDSGTPGDRSAAMITAVLRSPKPPIAPNPIRVPNTSISGITTVHRPSAAGEASGGFDHDGDGVVLDTVVDSRVRGLLFGAIDQYAGKPCRRAIRSSHTW